MDNKQSAVRRSEESDPPVLIEPIYRLLTLGAEGPFVSGGGWHPG